MTTYIEDGNISESSADIYHYESSRPRIGDDIQSGHTKKSARQGGITPRMTKEISGKESPWYDAAIASSLRVNKQCSLLEMLDVESPLCETRKSPKRRNRQDVLEDGKDISPELLEDMIRKRSITEIREKLFIIQQQLYTFHDMADKYEACNAKNIQLAEENAKVEAEKGKYETRYQKLRVKNKQYKNDLRRMKKQLDGMTSQLSQRSIQIDQTNTRKEFCILEDKEIEKTNSPPTAAGKPRSRRLSHPIGSSKTQPTNEQKQNMPRNKSQVSFVGQRRSSTGSPGKSSTGTFVEERDNLLLRDFNGGKDTYTVGKKSNIPRNSSWLSFSKGLLRKSTSNGNETSTSRSFSNKKNKPVSPHGTKLLSTTTETKTIPSSNYDWDAQKEEYVNDAKPVSKIEEKSPRRSTRVWLKLNLEEEKVMPRSISQYELKQVAGDRRSDLLRSHSLKRWPA
mmetsp:Transcript_35479/g.46994  ORF Transcript_35479/g.46994 Transcript_35479/m.46994 type:complete len:453 (+) Transcript_35479:105-1463(+)